jgi:hypothetical protein
MEDLADLADYVAYSWDFDAEAVADLVKFLRDESSSDGEDDDV